MHFLPEIIPFLAEYEDEHFKVVYEQDGRVESNYVRYERIAHAVKNGVWKPQKPGRRIEEYEFNRDQTECKILIGLAETQQTEKYRKLAFWIRHLENAGLRFLKAKKAHPCCLILNNKKFKLM